MLGVFFKSLLLAKKTAPAVRPAPSVRSGAKSVLNVGGGSKLIPIHDGYAGWDHVLLDIDPGRGPDVVSDARALQDLPASEYDSDYCSHNLEHYYRHDVGRVLAGFLHVLKSDGFAYIRVPDMGKLMKHVVDKNIDIEDIIYVSPAGPIRALDVIYGFGVEIETSGNDFYAHKTGFTAKSLKEALERAGFPFVFVFPGEGELELAAAAFKSRPGQDVIARFELPASVTGILKTTEPAELAR